MRSRVFHDLWATAPPFPRNIGHSLYHHSPALTRARPTLAANFGSSLFDLNLALLVFFLAVQLQGARDWRYFPALLRTVVSDYAVTIAVVTATIASYAFELVSAEVCHVCNMWNSRHGCNA